ncbi:hypothetical protein F4677DRAFT_463055 [Hypoxylon crocopeplum]|nr:hypothetical protein F4677DRAFT_463055 [Hypoxylon crocopeplum]
MPYDRLYRLDSTLCESRRLSPPPTLGMKWVFRVPYTFQDGMRIPASTYLERFDGLRRLHVLEERRRAGDLDDQTAKAFRFSTPTPTALNWGYGKLACPGRHFASTMIKMVLVELLADYDFAFCPENAHKAKEALMPFLGAQKEDQE